MGGLLTPMFGPVFPIHTLGRHLSFSLCANPAYQVFLAGSGCPASCALWGISVI